MELITKGFLWKNLLKLFYKKNIHVLSVGAYDAYIYLNKKFVEVNNENISFDVVRRIYKKMEENINNPKPTFVENCRLIKIKNRHLYEMLIIYARSKGVPIYKETSEDFWEKMGLDLIFIHNNICGINREINEENQISISIEQWFEYCDNWDLQSRLDKIGDYNTFLDMGVLKVGCQIITFTEIQRIIDIIGEEEEESKPEEEELPF